jgi:hypothetical protein
MSGSGSLSDFADSFGASTRSIGSSLRGCDPGSTEEADGAAILIAAPAPKVARQKTATHIVLAILDSKAFWIPRLSGSQRFLDSKAFWTTVSASRNRMEADLQDRIRAAPWLAKVNLNGW